MKRVVALLVGCLLVAGVVWALLPTEDAETHLERGGHTGAHSAERVSVAAEQSTPTSTAAATSTAGDPSNEEAASDSSPKVAELPSGDLEVAALPAAKPGAWQGVVRDAAGQPVEGVTVNLLGIPGSMFGDDDGGAQVKSMRGYFKANNQWDMLFQQSASTQTDAQGHFAFDAPEGSGPWQMSFSHDAYVVARSDDFESSAYPSAGASFGLVAGASLEVQVVTPDGQPIAGNLMLEREEASDEAIGKSTPFALHADQMQIMNALNGMDSAFSPFGSFAQAAEVKKEAAAQAEAEVESEKAVPQATPPADLEPAAEDADATGPRTVHGLPPGTVTVVAGASGFASGREEVRLDPGATASVTVRLELGLSLSGRVVDGDGNPIAGASISGAPMRAAFSPLNYGGMMSTSDATSADDGSFTVGGLEDAPYSLSASAEGYLEAQPNLMPGTQKTYRPGKAKPVTLTLQRELSLAGRVRGPVGDELTAIQVTAQARGGWQQHSAIVNADGSFLIEGLAPGRYELSGAGGEWVSFSPQNLSLGKGGASGVELELQRGLEVSVRVVSAGKPVEAATLTLSTDQDGMSFRRSPNLMSSTDASGQGTISGVAPGEYVLQVQHDQYAPAKEPLVVSAQGASSVQIELARGATLSGRVLTAAGEPVSGQLFATPKGEFMSGNVSINGNTDDTGAFTLEGIAAGTYDLNLMDMASMNGGAPQIQALGSFTVSAGQDLTQEFRLDPPEQLGTLKGRLLQGGEPLVMQPVQARGQGGDSMFDGGFLWFQTDAEGHFQSDQVRPGRYTISASGTGEVEVEVRGGQVSEVVLEVKSGVIAGRVLDQLGAPLSGATVYLRPARSSHEMDLMTFAGVGRATTDANGAFTVENLPAGSYRLAASGVGIGSSTPLELTLGDNESKTGLDVQLEPSPEVRLLVQGSDGAPLPNAEVSYYAAGLDAHSYELEFGSQQTTNAEGWAVFEELPPGDYVFAARSPVSGAAVTRRLSLGAGDEAQETLQLMGTGTLKVTGPPRTKLRVLLAQSQTPAPNPMANLFVSTNADGSCTIADLPAADYRVEATTEDGRTLSWAGTVPSGGEVPATLR